MKERILVELAKIEKEHDVEILFAVEAGSRAWGWHSKASDYDVRFVYVHRLEWYVSIDEKRDVIECPIHNTLDISGWDIRKALRLFAKSNPSLLEWIHSPVFYIKNSNLSTCLQKISEHRFNLKSTMYHYLHMASKNYREFLQGENMQVKKYFYVLRPILACKWLEEKGTVPPVEFARVINELSFEHSVLEEIKHLWWMKKRGGTLDTLPRMPRLHQFFEEQIAYYQEYAKRVEKRTEVENEELNRLFREIVFKKSGNACVKKL
ncbi:nucleotidyltransferase domain-containing protein [Bacillus cytotoxicus]|uniref:nucleotidyltransferase domain-containing protein n=1 Tax=Bacillus cytotoxicus TaxID=580165 RepID=UPI003D7E6175